MAKTVEQQIAVLEKKIPEVETRLEKALPFLKQQIAAWLLVSDLVSERGQAHLADTQAYLPLDGNAIVRIQGEGGLPDQWYEAVALLDTAVAEPRLASWSVIRSVTQDQLG